MGEISEDSNIKIVSAISDVSQDEKNVNEQSELWNIDKIPADENILTIIRRAKKKLVIGISKKEEILAKCRDLKEVLEYVDLQKKGGTCPSNDVFGEIVEMIAVNLFRELPSKTQPKCPDALDEKDATEPFWEQVHLAYTILQRLILLNGNEQLLRTHITERFLQQFMELFDSADLRERDKVKVVVHRAYCKIFVWRPFLRKKIGELLLRHIHQEDIKGVDQLLQLYGCIVTGFSSPPKPQHVQFLQRVLIPLHKPENLKDYNRFLTYCLVHFLYLDESLTKTIIFGILKYWPKRNSHKEVLVLTEIENLLQVIIPDQFQLVLEPLFKQLTRCMISPNVEVAKKAFTLWQDQRTLTMIVMFHELVMAIVFPVLYLVRKSHWNPTVTGQIYKLLKTFMIINRELFEELVKACKSTVHVSSPRTLRKETHKSVRFRNSEIILNATDTSEEPSSV